ncbi:cytochrome P450 [Artomyces pyxidatus]|uniref:Cytochrome P450 n=1 Tax=Artomyces pyxidatus TaxID=48021 RepID=A0ACB8SIP8_9AGAM|nr:cytochrome P450 [Artomyces pyxidatus]
MTAMLSSWANLSGNPISVVLAVGLLTFCITRYLRSPWRKVPPGPQGLPLVGNIRELANTRWLTSFAPRDTYGEIMYLRVPGTSVLILNSLRVAADLMDRRATIYSDRPHLILASEIYTGGLELALAPYGDVWRRMRRAAHEGLNATSAKRFHPVQTKEAVVLVQDMLADGNQWDAHLRRHSASFIMSAVYDTPTILPGDASGYESVKKINDHGARIELAVLPGSNWVQIFPWMKKIPSRFAKWKRLGEYWFARDSEMFHGLLGKVRNDLATGTDNITLGATFLKQQGRSGLSDKEIDWLAGIMFVAGADTTTISLSWWVVAMIVHPDVQARAHAEIDAVVGRDRVPTFADIPHLPYVRALVKETLRWRPAFPLGMPHSTTEDDWYEGMFIPKGTICFANAKAVNHDPAVYGDDSARFRPERHLGADGQLKQGPPDTKDEGHVGYGFGRRACVGRHLANNTMAIAVAMMLWATNIRPAKDEHGKDIPVEADEFVDMELVQRPVPFKCNIEPRFPEALDMLAAERERHG